MIRAVIFDLDNCLAPADEPGPELLEPTFAAIRRANRGTLSAERLERALAECWRLPLDHVAKAFGFSPAMLAAGWEVAAQAEVTTPMHGYGDLDVLAELPVLRFLVTSGFRRLQESKIRALAVEPFFDAVHVDAIDEVGRQGKQAIFAELLDAYGLQPGEVLVVGDSPASEIGAGNRLGMPTVQILREGVRRSVEATYHIRELGELRALIGR